MTIQILINELNSNTRKTKLVYDFLSTFTQISSWNGDVVWSGRLRDLTFNELQLEIIPSLLEME